MKTMKALSIVSFMAIILILFSYQNCSSVNGETGAIDNSSESKQIMNARNGRTYDSYDLGYIANNVWQHSASINENADLTITTSWDKSGDPSGFVPQSRREEDINVNLVDELLGSQIPTTPYFSDRVGAHAHLYKDIILKNSNYNFRVKLDIYIKRSVYSSMGTDGHSSSIKIEISHTTCITHEKDQLLPVEKCIVGSVPHGTLSKDGLWNIRYK